MNISHYVSTVSFYWVSPGRGGFDMAHDGGGMPFLISANVIDFQRTVKSPS